MFNKIIRFMRKAFAEFMRLMMLPIGNGELVVWRGAIKDTPEMAGMVPPAPPTLDVPAATIIMETVSDAPSKAADNWKHCAGNNAFAVPNTPEGRAFIASMRRFKVKGFSVRLRGRGRRAVNGKGKAYQYEQSLPLKYAEWFAVYIVNEKERERRRAEWMKEYAERRAVQREIDAIKTRISSRTMTFTDGGN